MIGINVRRWIYLQAVIALVCVLEEAIHRVKHLVAQQEEPFPDNVKFINKYSILSSHLSPNKRGRFLLTSILRRNRGPPPL